MTGICGDFRLKKQIQLIFAIMDDKPKIFVVAGPTASGKTSLAIKLACLFDGEIVNADSMQVYRGMDIGTAKPSMEEREGVIHHMFDVADPDEDFNASLYKIMGRKIIDNIIERNKICIVAGGSGFYIKALTKGLHNAPQAEPELREKLCQEWSRNPEYLYKRLVDIDPKSAFFIHPNDRARIVRYLEIFYITGCKPSVLSEEHRFSDCPYDVFFSALTLPREQLYDKIDKRCERMLVQGLIDETAALAEKYGSEIKPMNSIGYKHAYNYISGSLSLEDMILYFKRDTRHYAKRQITWFKADKNVRWFNSDETDNIVDLAVKFFRN